MSGNVASKFTMAGRIMNGASVEKYVLRDKKTGELKQVTREQCAYLVGRGLIEGVVGRLYLEQLIIEAAAGYPNISDLPTQNIKTGAMKSDVINSVSDYGKLNKRVEMTFDIMSLQAKTDKGNFAVKTGQGPKIINRADLAEAIKQNKVINANLQEYTKDGRTQLIIRLTDKRTLSSLPVVSEEALSNEIARKK